MIQTELDPLAAFLLPLFSQGRAFVLPDPTPRQASPRAIALLHEAFSTFCLDLAGAPLTFDPVVAASAAEVVRQSCAALVDRSKRPEDLAEALRMPHPPRTSSEHLSADLTFRYLSQIHHRARSVDPIDPLVPMLVWLLREWPLSGALADLDEPLAISPDFNGHRGLMILFAERLVARCRKSSYPDGVAGEYVELVRRFSAEGVA